MFFFTLFRGTSLYIYHIMFYFHKQVKKSNEMHCIHIHLATYVFTCFCLMKNHVAFFRRETTVACFCIWWCLFTKFQFNLLFFACCTAFYNILNNPSFSIMPVTLHFFLIQVCNIKSEAFLCNLSQKKL